MAVAGGRLAAAASGARWEVARCRAGDLWAQFKDSTTELWQVQIDQDARTSVTVSIVNQLNDFLKENARTSPGLPDSVQKLQAEAGIKLVIANTEDPDGIGSFVQYRVAFYVAGDSDALTNFFMLLDGYLNYKSKQLARATPFQVHIYPYADVDLNVVKVDFLRDHFNEIWNNWAKSNKNIHFGYVLYYFFSCSFIMG